MSIRAESRMGFKKRCKFVLDFARTDIDLLEKKVDNIKSTKNVTQSGSILSLRA